MPILIYGETGTGKEEAAKIIYKSRCMIEGDIPFVSVNCALLKRGTTDSELFGHKKGAFTGADTTTNGYIAHADGGILFLDEVHALPLDCQQRLLRVLNDGTYQRVGDTENLLKSDFQIITASTKNLDDEVEKGNFLLDLRGRISGKDILLKPLRDRKNDILDLIRIFFGTQRVDVSPEEIEKIANKCKEYYWQTNIRGLFNALRALIFECDLRDSKVVADLLPEHRYMMEPGFVPTPPNTGIPNCLKDVMNAFDLIRKGEISFNEFIKTIEKFVISEAIGNSKSVQEAARTLQIARATLDLKRKEYGLV